jgi:hypothetical protein
VTAFHWSSISEREPAWLTGSVVCLVMSVVAYVACQTFADPDLWGHVKFGQDILQSGSVADRDPYSYLTSGQVWINHEWLAEVIFAAVFALGGSPALILMKASLIFLTLGLVYWYLLRHGLSPLKGGIVLMFVILLVSPGARFVRPHIFTYLLLVITLLLLDQADRGRLRWLWGIPFVFALWANLHGGFLAGLAIAVVWSFTRIAVAFCRTRRYGAAISLSDVALAGSSVAAGIATLLNPYGVELFHFLVQPATFIRPDISEWQPTPIMSTYGVTYLMFLAVAAAGYLHSWRERRPGPLAVLCCVALAPLLAYRHGPLFGLAIPLLMGEHIGDSWNRWLPKARSVLEKSKEVWVQRCLAGLAITVASVFLYLPLPYIECIRIDPVRGTSFPARAVAVLGKSGAEGNLAIAFDWGEYAIWHLSPRFKVSLDGRRETTYSDEIRQENLSFALGMDDWDKLIRERDTHMALVQKRLPVFNLLKLVPNWVLVYEDSLGAIFAKQDSPFVQDIREANHDPLPDDGLGLCFP